MASRQQQFLVTEQNLLAKFFQRLDRKHTMQRTDVRQAQSSQESLREAVASEEKSLRRPRARMKGALRASMRQPTRSFAASPLWRKLFVQVPLYHCTQRANKSYCPKLPVEETKHQLVLVNGAGLKQPRLVYLVLFVALLPRSFNRQLVIVVDSRERGAKLDCAKMED